MATVECGPQMMARFYKMTVATTPIGIPETHLLTNDGKGIGKAVGVVLTNSVRMGVLGILTPSAASGLPLAANDVIVLDGAENVRNALFIQNSGGATIDWMLHTESA